LALGLKKKTEKTFLGFVTGTGGRQGGWHDSQRKKTGRNDTKLVVTAHIHKRYP